MALDEQLNDYFVPGMKQAILREEKAGNIIPPFDDDIYAAKKEGRREQDIAEEVTADEGPITSGKATVTQGAILENEAELIAEDLHQSGMSVLVKDVPVPVAPITDDLRSLPLTLREEPTHDNV